MARPPLSIKDRKPTTYVGCVLLELLDRREKTLPEFASEAKIDDSTVYRLIYGRPISDEVFIAAWKYLKGGAEGYALARAHLLDELARLGINPLSHKIITDAGYVSATVESKAEAILAKSVSNQMPWPDFKAQLK